MTLATVPVELIPLVCIACQSPVQAQPDEVAWVCETCQKGLLLGGDGRLAPLDVFYSDRIQPGQPGKPYWVASGKVTITVRETYSGDRGKEAREFWMQPRLFYIPAYAAALEEVVANGTNLLLRPVQITPGSPARFLPVVTPPDDVRPLAEFIVMSIEAERKDALKTMRFDIALAPPQLWVV